MKGSTLGVATVPKARGSICLAGPDPATPPRIDPNHLGAESDVRRMVNGVKVAREIAAAQPFAPWRAREVLRARRHRPVHGPTGVRAADASVVPRIVPMNTNATTIMIGEKAADLIRQPRG